MIADGRLTGGGVQTIHFTSSKTLPAIGDWTGINVRANGRFSLYEVQVQWAAIALLSYGPLGGINGFSVNRAGTGMYLVNAGAGQEIDRLLFENCDVGFRANNAPVAIRLSELIGHTWGAYNDTPSVVVDARNNWWGATNGPSGVGHGSSPLSAPGSSSIRGPPGRRMMATASPPTAVTATPTRAPAAA